MLMIASFIVSNLRSVPDFKVEVNRPQPVVISRRSDRSHSDIKLRVTVYAIVENRGGSGDVVVYFDMMQDGNTYTRTKIVTLEPTESKELEVTFDEVSRLGGQIEYSVRAEAK
ncbi:MAG: hypothetical protein EBX41_08400 [Chitinophagia bacterium]|nr:hypothetical protein [Chitinophagia bacterium]